MNWKRINMDSSWHVSWEESALLIDPWQIGSEIDGFSWLNEQWHTTPAIPLEELPDYKFILISQSYEDHCHLNTLQAIDTNIPLIATPKAFKRLKKHFPERQIHEIPEQGAPLIFGGLSFSALRPDKLLDPIYYSVVISDAANRGVFYAPHGFDLPAEFGDRFPDLEVELLVTTFTQFQLPAILGGLVNPGMENVRELFLQLRPKSVINTHDEQKKGKGLVTRFAKVRYPDYGAIASSEAFNFIRTPDYEAIKL